MFDFVSGLLFVGLLDWFLWILVRACFIACSLVLWDAVFIGSLLKIRTFCVLLFYLWLLPVYCL